MKSKILLICIPVFLVSCHKDIDIITTDDKPDPVPVLITTKLVTQNDTTIAATSQASQVFAGKSGHYNQFPYIAAQGDLINRDFELVRLETTDALEFYRVESLIENDVNYLHWMRPEVNFASANTTTHTELNLSTDYKIILPPNSILRYGGSAFNGDYMIAYSLLDPLTAASDAIPSYTGIRDHQYVSLQFQQCLYITALSESGEKLKFTESAYLQIPPALSQELWTFSKDQSAWIPYETQQVNSEIRLGSSIYYAIAMPDPAVRMTGTFSLNDKLTPHQELRILYGNTTRKIFTTNSGAWAAMIPAGILCTIEISLPCGSQYSTSFSSQEIEFNVPIQVTQETCVNTAYSGTVRDNDADALNGIIIVTGEHPNFYYADHPDFSFNVPTCLGNRNGIQGIDIANGQAGPVIYWDAADSVDVFSVFACEEANFEYLSLEVSADNKMYWDLSTSIDQSRLIIEEGISAGDLDLKILISGMEGRDYEDAELNMVFEDIHLGSRGYSLYCPSSPDGCGFTKFVITHFPAQQGQWIRGYFEGLFWIKTFTPLTAGYRPVKGEFQVFRDF